MSLLNDASLVMIPSGYKDTKLYSVKPTNGDGDFTFSRGSNLAATRVNSEGLIEKGRENLLLHSQDLTNPVYIDGGSSGYSVVRTANYATAPDGTQTADRIQISRPSGNTYAELYQRITTITGRACVVSFYGKSLSGNATLYGAFNGTNFGEFNFTSDWQRFEVFLDNAGASVGFNLLTWANLPNTSQSADVLIWGVQLEQGLVATDYIETTTTTVQAGILEDMPRLDYSGGASCPSLLLEPQRSNALTQSEYFEGSYYITEYTTLSTNATTSPEGVNNAASFIPNTTNANHRIYKPGTATTQTATYSIFIKPNGHNYYALRESTTTGASIGFDLATESITVTYSTGGCTASNGKIESYANGWYRISGTFSFSSATSQGFGLYSASPSWTSGDVESVTYAGDGTSGAYIYGAQYEEGTYPTSYIPTYGSSVTRSVDSCSKTGISSLIGQSEGTMFVDFNTFGFNNFDRFIAVTDGVNNRIGLIRMTGNNQLYFFVEVSGTLIINVAGISGTNVLGRHKIAAGYKSGDYVVYMDGVQVYTSSASGVPATSQLFVGTSEDGVLENTMSGIISEALLFKTRLTNDELADLTTL